MKEIHTKYRTIVSSGHFPPVIWNKAKGISVYDDQRNKFIDFTSAALVANAGHANPQIGKAIKAQVDRQLFYSYSNPSPMKLEYLKRLKAILPDYLDRVFLLTTGSEAVECAVRVMREWGQKKNIEKINIISHSGSFHGSTMASRALAEGGEPEDPSGFYNIPFPWPDCDEKCFDIYTSTFETELFVGVIVETFQGPSAIFMPKDYVAELRRWTKAHDALLVFDEIQAGFGRTGKWFGFEHYDVEPDLIIVGKGMTSSLPMSAVIGKSSILDSVGGLSGTHSGNSLCLVTAMANLDVIERDGLVENARGLGEVCREALESLKAEYPEYIGAINCKGLVAAFYLLNPETGRIDCGLAKRVIDICMKLGLLLLPTEAAGTVKIAPPLCINREALVEGIGVIGEAIKICLKKGE